MSQETATERRMRLSDALRSHAKGIERSAWPTALSRDLKRAAEQIEWLEAVTGSKPACGEGPESGEPESLDASAQQMKEERNRVAHQSAVQKLLSKQRFKASWEA